MLSRLAAKFVWTMECKRIVDTFRPIIKVLKVLKGESIEASTFAGFAVDVGLALRATLLTCKQLKGSDAATIVREYCQTAALYATSRSDDAASNGVWSIFALVLQILVLARRPGADAMSAARAAAEGDDLRVPVSCKEDFEDFLQALLDTENPSKAQMRLEDRAREYFAGVDMKNYANACESARAARIVQEGHLDCKARETPPAVPSANEPFQSLLRAFNVAVDTCKGGSKENVDKLLAQLPECLSAAIRRVAQNRG